MDQTGDNVSVWVNDRQVDEHTTLRNDAGNGVEPGIVNNDYYLARAEPVARSCRGGGGFLGRFLVGFLVGFLGKFVRAQYLPVPGSEKQYIFQYTEPDICRPLGLFI